jgi:hypothetical protein
VDGDRTFVFACIQVVDFIRCILLVQRIDNSKQASRPVFAKKKWFKFERNFTFVVLYFMKIVC